MKLKHRLSLYAVLIFSVIILIVSSVIYVLFYTEMERREMESLDNKSLIAAIYYLEKDELSIGDHEDIKSQLLKTISRNDIAVFDSLGNQYYGNMLPTSDIHLDYIQMIRKDRNRQFSTHNYFYNGIYYEDNQGNFVVVTRESKGKFNAQMQSLWQILLAVSIFGILIVFLFSWYLGKLAYVPFVNIVQQIRERDSHTFHQPLSIHNTYQELDDLVQTYNSFVDRIAQVFAVQKNFIDYVSHELRTPITALLGTLEVTNQRPRTIGEYEQVLQQLKQYVGDLEETMDNMLLLSGAKTKFEFSNVRVDEIVWQVIENAVLYHQAHIDVDIQVQHQSQLVFSGNDKLLELAITNIIENAIKYSENKPVRVELYLKNDKLQLRVTDQGIGIPEKDLVHVKQNFFRAGNAKGYQGKGIGLSMANIILNLHQIGLSIRNTGNGTEVTLSF